MRLLYKTGAMESLRKWFYKPKRDDRSLLAQFFFADETLNMVAAELDSFDGREEPERCSTLVNQLRHAQERVLNITGQIMDQLLGNERVARGFRVKFPEDVLQDNLAGQLWFGAECLAAGSSIMNREEESAAMRPLAKALTRSLETVRALLREHCLRCNQYGASLVSCCSEMLHESLKIFDRLFAEFELCYVSAMVPVKSPAEFEVQQHICVLFSETLQRARRIGLLTQDQVDDYDPALMFAIPRLAIVSGLLIFSNGPLSIDKAPEHMSDMFRPFRTLLHKIRQLLWTLDRRELYLLEKLLCTNEDIANIRSSVDTATTDGTLALKMDSDCYPDISEFVTRFYSDNAHCKDVLSQMVGAEWGSNTEDTMQIDPEAQDGALSARLTQESDYLPDNVAVLTPILDGFNTLRGTNAENLLYGYPEDQTIMDAVEPIGSSVDDDQTTDPSLTATQLTTGNGENREIFHSRKEDIIRLNVQGPEDDAVTDKDLETIQENVNLTLTRMERRNSNLSHASSRKSSRNESLSNSHPNDFMIRNLSSNGLSMFDPLAGASTSSVNINPTASDNNVLLPDQLLVSNLSEQVSEIADKLSCITYGEHPDNSIDNMRNFSLMDSSITTLLQDQVAGQMYSFSANDMSNLISNDSEFQISRNNVNYSPSRSDKVIPQLTNMPSTSHGYLIPNAISQEPAILTTLSNNNPGMYDDEMFLNPINNPLMISQQSTNLENELFGDSISIANANLSSLLLTNEEFHNRFLAQNATSNTSNVLPKRDEARFYSASDETITSERVADYHAGQNVAHQRAKFLIGYDSDPNENTPGDSGICTENTSLDRSPDSEIHNEKNMAKSSIVKITNTEECLMQQNTSNEIDRIDATCGHFMDQNCILSNNNNQRLNSNDKNLLGDPAQLSNSFSSSTKGPVTIDCGEQDVISSLHINYSENSSNVQKNDAGPSHNMMQRPEFIQNSSDAVLVSDISVNDCKHSLEAAANASQTCDKNLCSNYINSDSVSTESGSLETNVAVLDRTCNNNLKASSSVKVDNCDTNLSCSVNESSANVRTSTSNETSAISTEDQRNPVENSDSILTSAVTNIQVDSLSTYSGPSEEVVSVVDQSDAGSNAIGVLNQRKLRKSSSPKNKKKRSVGSSRETRISSPGRYAAEHAPSFILDHGSRMKRRSPMRLNLDQLMDDRCVNESSADVRTSTSNETSAISTEDQRNPIENSDSILSSAATDIQVNSFSINSLPSEEVVSAVDQSDTGSNATGVLNQRKLRKSSSPKNKKKRSAGSSRETRTSSPGRYAVEHAPSFILEHRTRMKMNQLLDDSMGSGDCPSSQSSATSSFHSECADDEEIALALQAQELASRHHTRAKFRSSEDLIHRLFVCIAGVADQLQTNFATDLRNILKSVFLMNQTPEIEPEKLIEPEEKPQRNRDGDTIEYEVSESEVLANGDSFDSIYSAEEVYADNSPTSRRSRQSLTALEGASNTEENIQNVCNNLEERHNSQPSRQDSQRSINSRVSETSINTQQNCDNVEQSRENSNDNQNSPKSFNRKTNTSRSSSSTSSDSNRNNTIENCYDSESLSSNSRVSQVADQQQFNGNVREGSRGNTRITGGESDETSRVERGHRSQSVSTGVERAPEWVPDIAAPDCMRCRSHFTAFRRRHHCRNCGKVFCATCSSNSIPLPRFGQLKPVRVCEECFQTTAKRSCGSSNHTVHAARRQTYTHR